MKSFIVLSLFVATAVSSHRSRRAAFDFADGVDEVVGQIRTTFQCPQRYGYYADVDNDCKVFHLCNPVMNSEGAVDRVDHYSFFCGNQTVFNQLTLTCSHPEEAVPCPNAPDFFYVNDNFGRQDVPFLTDDDLQRGSALYPGYSQAAAAAATTNHYRYADPHQQDEYSNYENSVQSRHYYDDQYTAAASHNTYSYQTRQPQASFGKRIRH